MIHWLKHCPNCLEVTFYVELPSGLVFLNLRQSGAPQDSRPPHAVLEQLDLEKEELFCTGCSWHGQADELLAPKEYA